MLKGTLLLFLPILCAFSLNAQSGKGALNCEVFVAQGVPANEFELKLVQENSKDTSTYFAESGTIRISVDPGNYLVICSSNGEQQSIQGVLIYADKLTFIEIDLFDERTKSKCFWKRKFIAK